LLDSLFLFGCRCDPYQDDTEPRKPFRYRFYQMMFMK